MVSRGLDEVCFGVIVEYNTSQHEQELTMHRKLIHSVHALGIALSLLTAALFLAEQGPVRNGVAATAPVAATHTQTADKDKAAMTRRHRRAQARAEMALPFFSFAQGLRRGNRS
jgi:hypothetical protein